MEKRHKQPSHCCLSISVNSMAVAIMIVTVVTIWEIVIGMAVMMVAGFVLVFVISKCHC